MLRGRHVFIIEDDEALGTVLREALEDEHAIVSIASDAETALQLLERERPDVILLDSGLPGLSSYDFVDRYLALPGPHAPIIRATATTWKSPPPHPAVRYHLPKPFDLDRLAVALRSCLDELEADAPPAAE